MLSNILLTNRKELPDHSGLPWMCGRCVSHCGHFFFKETSSEGWKDFLCRGAEGVVQPAVRVGWGALAEGMGWR